MTNKLSKYTYKTWLPLLLAGSTAFGMLVGYRMSNESSHSNKNMISQKMEVDGHRLNEILGFIDSRYVDSVDKVAILDAATDAIFSELDKHSVYIPPVELDFVNESMSGFYDGLGIYTILYKDTLRVTKVIDESPAKKSGIKYGDLIVSVNDSILAGKGISRDDQWTFLKEVSHEEVLLGIINNKGKTSQLIIKPGRIQSPNVRSFMFDDQAYISIEKFSDKTYEEIINALESLQKEMHIDKLILDLRGNPGGYLPEATKILNQLFVEDKRILVYTKDKNDRKSEYKTTGRPFYKVNKLAVLIDGGSASASEIIAGALQDWDKAIVIGENSYGKGLVQEQYELSNGGAIRLTTARYYTPLGRYIQTPFTIDSLESDETFYSKLLNRSLYATGGIAPDVEVFWNEEEQKTRDLAFFKRNELAYEFILENNLDSTSNIEQYQVQLDKLLEGFYELNQVTSIKNQELFKTMIVESIHRHLKQNNLAEKRLMDYDIYLRQATESLKQESIFTDNRVNDD